MVVKNLFLIAVIVLSSCRAQNEDHRSDSTAPVSGNVFPGEYLVGMEKSELEALLAEHSEEGHRFSVSDEGFGISFLKTSLAEDHAIIQDVKAKAKLFSPNQKVQLQARDVDFKKWPKDPYFLGLWGLHNVGQDAPGSTEGSAGADMEILKAWEISKGSKEIKVAVIDTGVDYNHPDLKGNILINEAEANGSEGVDDDGNGYVDDVVGWNFSEDRTSTAKAYHGIPGNSDPMDGNGHGTHCAGTIGALGGNAEGIVGVNWNVSILPIKFLSNAGSGSTLGAFRAIRYAMERDVDIMSNSWGGGPENDAIRFLIQKAAEKGILFVAASGNSGQDTSLHAHYPSNYDVENVISVGASTNRDKPAYFSNYSADKVHVFAPGYKILSTVPPSVFGGEKYASFSGTSMATPHVAGLAALLMAARPEFRRNPAKLIEHLIQTSDSRESLYGMSRSNGRVNAYRALQNEYLAAPAAVDFLEEGFAYTSTSFPDQKISEWVEIHKEGASAIKVHFDYLQIGTPFDSVWLYDSSKKFVAEVEVDSNIRVDVWTRPIKGDKMYVRFVNAKTLKDDPVANTKKESWNNDSEGFRIDKIAYKLEGAAQ